MSTCYYVTYYVNRQPHEYAWVFTDAFTAIRKAEMWCRVCKLATDVMERGTGEIIAIFEPNNSWIAPEYKAAMEPA